MNREEIRETLCKLKQLHTVGEADITSKEIIEMCDTLLRWYRPRKKGVKK